MTSPQTGKTAAAICSGWRADARAKRAEATRLIHAGDLIGAGMLLAMAEQLDKCGLELSTDLYIAADAGRKS
jgi:hypothetical protein